MIRKPPEHSGRRGEEYVRRTAKQYQDTLPWADVEAISICNAINVSYNAARNALAQRYDKLGLGGTLGRSTLLRVRYFAGEKPLTHNEIGAELQLTPGTVTYLVSELVKDGFVTRTVDPRNRRTAFVTLTAEGEDVCSRLVPALAQFMAEVCNDFTPEEASTFLTLLFKFTKGASATYPENGIAQGPPQTEGHGSQNGI